MGNTEVVTKPDVGVIIGTDPYRAIMYLTERREVTDKISRVVYSYSTAIESIHDVFLAGPITEMNSSGETKICVENNYDCGSFIKILVKDGRRVDDRKWFITTGNTSCKFVPGLPGSSFGDGGPNRLYSTGTYCKLEEKDWPQTPENLHRCCTGYESRIKWDKSLMETMNEVWTNPFLPECPMGYMKALRNTDCDDYLNHYCVVNRTSNTCMFYAVSKILSKRNAFDFLEFCATNMNHELCSLISVALTIANQRELLDPYLIRYCGANPNDTNCRCFFASLTPPPAVNNADQGPMECWYKPCAELPKQQFLLSAQIVQRRRCQLINCTIDIKNIRVDHDNPSKIVLENFCNPPLEITNPTFQRPGGYNRKYALTLLGLTSLFMF